MSWSHYVGATLLVGSGFLAAYALATRSRTLLEIEASSAARVVCAEVFGFLAAMAAGGVVSFLFWRVGAISGLRLSGGSSLTVTDIWMGMLTVDMEVFYLARPLLSAVLITLGVVAALALFKDTFQPIIRRVFSLAMKEKRPAETPVSPSAAPLSGRPIRLHMCFPYLALAASVALGVAITVFPYFVANVRGILGSDSWFYYEKLGSMSIWTDAFRETDRSFVLLFFFLVRTVTGLSTDWVVRLMPALLSALLALSSFALVREGTGRSWVAAFAALLSVVSAQTSLGMGAGILASWFALSVANFALALVVRSIRLHSAPAAAGSLAVLFILLASYAYMWVVILAVLVLVLVASIVQFRTIDRRGWRYEVGILSGVLVGGIVIPVVFLLAATPFLGYRPYGLDPNTWFVQSWDYLTRTMTPSVLGSSVAALEEALDFAGNRVDLPFLTLLSIVGLLHNSSRTRSSRRIIAAMVLVPIAMTLITTFLLSTWRGLYVIPLYLTGALGAEDIIYRVNGQESPWKSRSRLAFTGTFAAYVFLSHLDYSLRALALLLAVAPT
jgi:hypothetical protein